MWVSEAPFFGALLRGVLAGWVVVVVAVFAVDTAVAVGAFAVGLNLLVSGIVQPVCPFFSPFLPQSQHLRLHVVVDATPPAFNVSLFWSLAM